MNVLRTFYLGRVSNERWKNTWRLLVLDNEQCFRITITILQKVSPTAKLNGFVLNFDHVKTNRSKSMQIFDLEVFEN